MSKTYYVSKPGTLISMMTEEEANSVTHLTLTGKLNAEDFRHLRDEFDNLKVLDISNAEIKMYSGKAGTYPNGKFYIYMPNFIPAYAFSNVVDGVTKGKATLEKVILSEKTKNIEDAAFKGCENLKICQIRKKTAPNLLPEALADSVTAIFVPLGSSDSYRYKDRWQNFAFIEGEPVETTLQVGAMGKLEEKRFELLCAEYEKEQAELEQLLASEQAQLDQFHEDTDRASHFLALAQKYTDFTELTAPMIHEFVEKILVHAPDRSTGERVQEIEIYLNFVGKFEVPMPEPTEEELAAEEKRRQKRIRDHEKYLRQKERKQKIAEGLIVPGEPYQLVCQCCGEPFQSVRPNAKFCKPACREKFYRQEKRKAKETETSQTA